MAAEMFGRGGKTVMAAVSGMGRNMVVMAVGEVDRRREASGCLGIAECRRTWCWSIVVGVIRGAERIVELVATVAGWCGEIVGRDRPLPPVGHDLR